MSTTRVWDLPTRLFHWSLAAAFLLSWLSSENDWMDVHMISGYVVLGLVLFRIVWGLVGSGTSRFSHFLRWPWVGLAHLRQLVRKQPDRHLGHTPSGGWMVLLMLVLLLAQATMGLFATDGLFTEGPLASTLNTSTAEEITEWHEALGEILPYLVGLHILVVLWVVGWKKEPIISAMFSGRRGDLPEGLGEGLTMRSGWIALLISAILAAAIVSLVWWGG